MSDVLSLLADVAPQYHADIIRAATRVWVSRQIEDEKPPPIQPAKLQRGTCPWCFEQLGDQRSEFNGGIGHPECARHAYEAVAADDAMPWPIPKPSTHDPLIPFCERLGREAGRLGIDVQKLAQAIGRARRA